VSNANAGVSTETICYCRSKSSRSAFAHEAISLGIHVRRSEFVLSSSAMPAMLNGSKSMRRNLCLLLLVLASLASAADRAEEVRATEIAFAKAFADRDAKRFFSYLADDAQFLGRSATMHGKQEVIAAWSEFFKPALAPFRWQPERVVINAAGDLGFSSGPVFDEAGAQIGTFTSTWVRQPDGPWKILFDGGSVCPTTKQSGE
jgi:ketosteroid isomerase-like protein